MAALAFLFAHNSRIVFPGGVSERPKVLASKASVVSSNRGFKSLRHRQNFLPRAGSRLNTGAARGFRVRGSLDFGARGAQPGAWGWE